jgi:hypothetical protein
MPPMTAQPAKVRAAIDALRSYLSAPTRRGDIPRSLRVDPTKAPR